MNERIKELVCRVERIKDMYDVGPVQRAAIEDFVGLIAQDCARLCEEVAKDADCIAKSEFVTDAGRQLHQGMWGGATNCNKIIKHQFGIEE